MSSRGWTARWAPSDAERARAFRDRGRSHCFAKCLSLFKPGNNLPAMSPTLSLNRRATQDLDFIRRTMERATAFTAVPGKGLVGNGFIALVTAAVASRAASNEQWLILWLAAAVAACAVGVGAMVLKARRAGIAMLS